MPGIVPYVVRLESLRSFFGSKNVPELEKIKSLNKQYLADYEADEAPAIAAGSPSLGAALDHLCVGEIRKPDHPAPYAWALELLCAHFGQKQSNRFTESLDDNWLVRNLDPVFRGWGLGTVLSTATFLRGAWPLPIPSPRGLPTGGTLTPSEIEHALMAMRAGAVPRVDQSVISVLGDLRGWLETASGSSSGVVCFYY